jgi:hypothetical protein
MIGCLYLKQNILPPSRFTCHRRETSVKKANSYFDQCITLHTFCYTHCNGIVISCHSRDGISPPRRYGDHPQVHCASICTLPSNQRVDAMSATVTPDGPTTRTVLSTQKRQSICEALIALSKDSQTTFDAYLALAPAIWRVTPHISPDMESWKTITGVRFRARRSLQALYSGERVKFSCI